MKSSDVVLNRTKAVEYALKYAEFPNVEASTEEGFWYFLEDCTNFVSQCWNYAGMPQNDGWYWHNRTNYSKSWTLVDDFANYMTYYSAMFMDDNQSVAVYKWSSNEVEPGDIIQFCNGINADGSENWHHSAIITRIEDGEIHYAQHTINDDDRVLSAVYPDPEIKVRFICPRNAVY